MVFESLVADLLNKFIGDYVENLDKSQLKLGIWGGNVVLENLKVKENALSEFNVPFKVKAGQIGKLILKIPWKNLYNDAVVATLDGLYLLVVPGATETGIGIKYDAAKEEKYLQEAKQKELLRIEEALQMAAERGTQTGDFLFDLESYVYKDVKPGHKHKKRKKHFKKSKRREHKQGMCVCSIYSAVSIYSGLRKYNPKDEKKDSFQEKLLTQVIKNLQVKITNIHIRYEDDITDPEQPFSVGVTLKELSLQTADENWKPCILNNAAKIIYKLVRLDCLCAYWNVKSRMFYHGTQEDILGLLKEGIASSIKEPKDYQYIFRPIFASAKLCINPHAEIELKSPKMYLDMEVQSIAIEMTRPQYLSMIDLLESVDYMVRNAQYRKYKPELPLHKNARKWWGYAITSVLEVHIRRPTQMWLWSSIRKHREHLRAYKTAYKTKLTQSKCGEETLKQLQDLETTLDVFNITLARQQARVEVIRSGLKMLGKKATQKEKQGGGWFGGFFGKKEGKKKAQEEESSAPESFDEFMTAEEKAKLYTAIGYSGSSHNLALPKEYVASIVTFKLLSTSITVREEAGVPETLKVQMISLSTSISQRPGAQALKVEAKLEHWYVTGLQQRGAVPSLIASVGDATSSLLHIRFETNPEGSTADQLLVVQSQPVEIIYDARTVIGLAEFFQSAEGIDLEMLTSATLMKLEEIKEKTATGLSHIIETHKVLDLQINLKPSYLLVPQTGFYDGKSNLLILDFGSLQLNSVNQGGQQPLSPSFNSLEEIMDRAYEKFDLELQSVQLLYCKSGESWKDACHKKSSKLHILQPMDIKVQLAKSMVDKDVRMAKFKVSGELPLLHVRMSDQKIKEVMELAESIPLPQRPSTPTDTAKKVPSISLADARTKVRFEKSLNAAVLLEAGDTASSASEEEISGHSPGRHDQQLALPGGDAKVELTDLQLKFEIKEVLVELTQQESQETLLALNVAQLGTEVKLRPYDLTVTSYLKKVNLDYCEIRDRQNQPIHLISSSDKPGSDLLKVEFIKADNNGPNFKATFDNTEQTLKVAFSSLNLLLHTQALLSTISFMTAAVPSSIPRSTGKDQQKKSQGGDSEKGTVAKTVSKGSKDKDIFHLKVFVVLDSFHVAVCDERRKIANIKVQGLDTSVFVKTRETQVSARLRDIVVTDIVSSIIHQKAVSIAGEEVFSFNMALYPNATEGDAYTDTSNVDGKVTLRVGCIQIVYLHKFLMSLLDLLSYKYSSSRKKFVDNFQTAKEALSVATAQAAEKAASSVRDFAQKSFRLSMDIKLKAPVIIIPQSSVSQNAVVVDLGLITVQNQFCLVPADGDSLPPVIDKMKVQLTELKLSRVVLQGSSSQPEIEILQPVNLDLTVNRNLAASWYDKIPAVKIKGGLETMNVVLSLEDLGVLMKILVENIAEGSKELSGKNLTNEKAEDRSKTSGMIKLLSSAAGETGSPLVNVNTSICEEVAKVHLDFEIKEVVVKLTKPVKEKEYPFLVLHVSKLGTEARVRNYDMGVTAYLKKISMKYLGFTGEPLNIIRSSDEPGADLLKVEYHKADKNGPDFKTVYNNTEQMITVAFSSLDLLLHTQALLSSINFLTAAMSSGSLPSADKERDSNIQAEEQSKSSALKPVSAGSQTDGDVIDLKLTAKLGAFNVFVCDENCDIADIRIRGIDASVSMQSSQTQVFARLGDIIVTDVDSKTIHKKAVSIAGDEVFSFNMALYPNATEGDAYTNTSNVDGKVTLRVGCIQIVYLHKFLMSLVNFSNNFQTAKEALSVATAQAAEKAASSVRDFSQKSFRLSMDIKLKAPVIIIPQSSVSQNAVEVDLGLITVQNQFCLVPADEGSLPPVIDKMDVQLTELKLSRILLQEGSVQPNIELLQPVNLRVSVKRNLAAAWCQKIPAVEINGDLKPMKVALSQDDLTVLLKIVMENIGEAANPQTETKTSADSVQKQGGSLYGSDLPKGSAPIKKEDSNVLDSKEPYETLKFDFNFESLSLVLYNSDPTLKAPLSQRQDSLRIGEFILHLMTASGKMFEGGALEASTKLTACTLDDCRQGIERVTSRMVDRKDDGGDSVMIDLSFTQRQGESSVVAVLQKLYVCASVEFLLAVADFFIKAMPQGPTPDKSNLLQLKQVNVPRAASEKAPDSSRPKMKIKAVVIDPEVVFVANLMKADAPALAASFQCDFTLVLEGASQKMTASLRELKVLACPFLRDKGDKAVTTVLRPACLTLEARMHQTEPLTAAVTVDAIIIKIKNHFSIPFAIYKFSMKSISLEPVGEAEPEKEFHVPLDSYRCQLFLRPVGMLDGQFKESSTFIAWKEELHRSSEVRGVLQCPSSEINYLPLIVNTVAVPDELSFISSHGEEDWDPAYLIHLCPTVTMRNLLPYTVRYLLEGTAETHELAEGSSADVHSARISGEIMELVLVKYQGRNWNGHIKIHEGLPEFFLVRFTSDCLDSLSVDLSIHVGRTNGQMVLSVFSPYWIINKTNRVLQYRAEEIQIKHPSDFRDIILFSFKKKNIFSKNKVQLCVSTSTWSSSFSLDTVGSYGCVKCPANNMEYLVGVSIQMSSFNLTRIVIMSPFYTLVNKSSFELEVGEVQTTGTVTNGKWHYIAADECLPLWPETTTGKLCVRVVGSETTSKSFFFNKQDNGTLLGMDLCGGIIAAVNIADHATVISFSDYYEGAAPALIINHTLLLTLKYQQSGNEELEKEELKPGEAKLFAWNNPAAIRKLSWSCSQQTGELDLIKDESGQFCYNQNTQIHWVSFLDGRQRVLLFTEDVAIVTKARQAEEMEQFEKEINVSLQNLGLSLINNENKQEISYIGITSSGVVWEMKPKQRWKPFNQKNINLLEQTYQKHLSTKKQPGWIKLENNFEVNFTKIPMEMRHPLVCNIRRNFLSGIQVEFKQSPHQRSLRAQLHWLQVDNQLPGAIFPIVFHPVPPPKSIALDSEPKPFIDVSIISRFNEHSQVMQFKYFMALVQEMALKIDQGFLGAIIALFTPVTDLQADKQKTKLIEQDLEALKAELMESSITDTSGLGFFEHFHISPIKLHLSVSLGSGEESDKQDMVAIQSINLLLKSIGATLTDVDDLIFKLACFEVRYQFYRRDQLMWTVSRHYVEQFLKQMYVLVLGLDVLGNPFGLIRGLSEGVEAFFYEPFQGAVQGPEEFAEGFVIGVRSLLGHTVGGAAGVVSRITGSVGKGLAAITMDKEYQQKRREEMNRQPKDFGDSLAKGGKGLLWGVVGGVTGIVTKPVEGAKKEGAAGFFKGLGKGLVGVVARPTGGIVDMASSTFQGIQRVAESTEEVSKIRPPRLIREDGIVRPFNQGDAEGYDLFQRSEIKKLEGELFREHCKVPGSRKTSLVVTNRRVMCLKEIDFVDHINKDWECLFENFTRPPSLQGNTLNIYTKDQGIKMFQNKDSQDSVREVPLQDPDIARKMCSAIDEAKTSRQQHQLVKQKSRRFIKQNTLP
ncbi:vacuolar protein sorting-associated protein 13C-like [Polyodon spathula]|uniref:vacuolar protein sorting-associated protein 13C-like n=1 Tax=Polyodon spathula TaxID=7913 RepID=UPI001B7DCFC6|nr:vacuolar protein sorting-associated protein 13C-like [Polyodon spathula]